MLHVSRAGSHGGQRTSALHQEMLWGSAHPLSLSLFLSVSLWPSLALPRTLGDGVFISVARITTVKLPANQKGPVLLLLLLFFTSSKTDENSSRSTLSLCCVILRRLSVRLSPFNLSFFKKVNLESPSFFSCLFKCLLCKYPPLPPSPRSISAPLSTVLRCDKRLH